MPNSPIKRAKWSAKQVGRFKPLLFLLALTPFFRWFWLGFTDNLGANPPEFLIDSTGVWALAALCLALAVTPLRRLIKQPALARCRRMLGLFAFFYTFLHVLGWAYWERGWSLTSMGLDIVQRPFVAIGVIAVVPLLAMALTSTQGWVRRLGRWWQILHRAIYIIAALSVWHFWLMRAGKNDFFEPNTYGVIVALLLLARLAHFIRTRAKARYDRLKKA